MESDLGVRVAADQLPGIDLGEGNIKTNRGTIRTPKSSLKKQDKRATQEVVRQVEEVTKNIDVPTIPVVINTDFGDITYNCVDIVRVGNYLILEMNNNNFSPKSYQEAPNLRLPINWEGNTGTFVFTGCKWTQKRTGKIFVILLEVHDDDQELS